MKNQIQYYPLVLAGFLLTTLSGCLFPKETDYPEVTTNSVTSIAQTTATCGGTITSDGNATITEKGVCWSQWYTPYTSDNRTIDGTGSGSFTSYITGLTANTTYYVRAYATNEMGTSYGASEIFTTTGGGGGPVTDVDGNVYTPVTIGTQVWMLENLKTTHYRNGDAISYVSDFTSWGSQTGGAYCNYEDQQSNASVYGRLYNWFAVNDSRSIAPTGWHVASFNEWNTLVTYLGGDYVAGGKLKESGTAHWNSPNNATNESGFTGLPSGGRSTDGTYFNLGYSAGWWTATEYDGTDAWGRSVLYNETTLYTVNYMKQNGYAVRCVKD